jgi:hypothetical protein
MSSKSLSDKRFYSYVKVVSYSFVLWRRMWIFSLRETTTLMANIIGWTAYLTLRLRTGVNRSSRYVNLNVELSWKKFRLLKFQVCSQDCATNPNPAFCNSTVLKMKSVERNENQWTVSRMGVYEDTERKMLRVLFKFEELLGVERRLRKEKLYCLYLSI